MDPCDELQLREAMEVFVRMRQAGKEQARMLTLPFTQSTTVQEFKSKIHAKLETLEHCMSVPADSMRLFFKDVLHWAPKINRQ